MRIALLAAASAAVLSLLAPAGFAADASAASPYPDHYGAWGVDLSAGDPSVKPGDDFFRYTNGRCGPISPPLIRSPTAPGSPG